MKICLNKVYILLVLFFISSCGVKKSVIKELETINVSEIIDKINSRKINSNWLYIKGKIKIKSDNEKVTLGISIKIRQDSLIWASISAPIIGEINRIMISPDSLYMINRTNSTWLIKPIDKLNRQIGLSLSYSDIQAFISNTIRIPNTEILKDSPAYPEISVVNINDVFITDNIDSASYLISGQNKFIKEINLNYSQNQKAIIEYSDYNNDYSKQLIVFVSKPELNFELTYNKVEPRETDKVSFKIPERYDEVK